jgi:hypothetical protein
MRRPFAPSPSLPVSPSLFQVRGPRVLYQQPHHNRGRDRVARVVEQPDGNETEDEGTRRAPEPEVLMEDIKSTNDDQQQWPFHSESGRVWPSLAEFVRNRRQNVCVLWHSAEENCNAPTRLLQ